MRYVYTARARVRRPPPPPGGARTTVVHLVARGAPRLAHLPHAAEPRAPGGYTAVKSMIYTPLVTFTALRCRLLILLSPGCHSQHTAVRVHLVYTLRVRRAPPPGAV